MILQLLQIFLIGSITLISLTTETHKKENKKKSLTYWGWATLSISVLIILLNLYNQFDENNKLKILKPEEIYAEIEIVSYSKEKINKTDSILPEKLYARDTKIGNDNLQIDFEKEIPISGKARSFSSWHLYYKTTNIKLDELRLESNTADQLNGKTFQLRIPQFEKIYSDSLVKYIRFNLRIRNRTMSGFIDSDGKFISTLEEIK